MVHRFVKLSIVFLLVQPHLIFFDGEIAGHHHIVVAQDQDDLSILDPFDQYSTTTRPTHSIIDDENQVHLDVSGWVARRHKIFRSGATGGFSLSRKGVAGGTGAVFVWRHATRMTDPINWVNRDVACDGDWLRVDAQRIFVASLGDGLKADVVDLPMDGVWFFDRAGAVLGERGRWQCGRRKSAEARLDNFEFFRSRAYISRVDGTRTVPTFRFTLRHGGNVSLKFQPDRPVGNAFFGTADGDEENFHDPRNWLIYEEVNGNEENFHFRRRHRPRLDAEMVPDHLDDVIFPSDAASIVRIDQPVRVASLNFSGKLYNSEAFYGMLMTMEGQLQFRLNGRLASERNIDRLSFQWPHPDALSVAMAFGSQIKNDLTLGIAPSNAESTRLQALCERIECPPTERVCTKSALKAHGQCCAQCSAMLVFRQNLLNFIEARATVADVEEEYFSTFEEIGMSFTRIDITDIHPIYQIAIISPDAMLFDESLFAAALEAAFRRIQAKNLPESVRRLRVSPIAYDVRIQVSVDSRRIHWGRVIRCTALFGVFLALVMFALRQHYQKSARFRLWINDLLGGTVSAASVRWHNAKQQAIVELQRRRRSGCENIRTDHEDGMSSHVDGSDQIFYSIRSAVTKWRYGSSFPHHAISYDNRNFNVDERLQSDDQLGSSMMYHAEFANLAFSNALLEEGGSNGGGNNLFE